MRPPRHLTQLSILGERGCGIGILDIETQLNSIKIIWTQRLFNPSNLLLKDLMLSQLKLNLNSNQVLALFRQKQILRSTSNKNLRKQNNEDFFIQLLYVWLHLISKNFPAPCL